MSEKVACPFCDTDVTLEYLGGISFGRGGVLWGASPMAEGTCSKCGACVSARASLFDVLVCATRPKPRDVRAAIVILQPDEVNSYIVREGVKIP